MNTALAVAGPRLTEVLLKAYDKPFAVQSDFARSYSGEVAAAASTGLITSLVPEGIPTREWRVTPRGLGIIHKNLV